MLEIDRIVALADDVVLMEDVAKEMPVIELMNHRLGHVGRQVLEPVRIVAPESDVQGDNVLNLLPVDGAIAHCSTFVARSHSPRGGAKLWLWRGGRVGSIQSIANGRSSSRAATAKSFRGYISCPPLLTSSRMSAIVRFGAK